MDALSATKYRRNTFFTVVFVLMQHKAAPTLTAVASKGVNTLMLAAAILLRTLIFVCSKQNIGTLEV